MNSGRRTVGGPRASAAAGHVFLCAATEQTARPSAKNTTHIVVVLSRVRGGEVFAGATYCLGTGGVVVLHTAGRHTLSCPLCFVRPLDPVPQPMN